MESETDQPVAGQLVDAADTAATAGAPVPAGISRSKRVPIFVAVPVALCLAGFGLLFVTLVNNTGPMLQVLDRFMSAMADGNVQAAMVECAPGPAGPDEVAAGLREWASGTNAVLFDGYLGIEPEGINLTWSTGEGLVATVNVAVTYNGGYTGALEANLVRLGDRWQISGINLTVPPEKLDGVRRTVP